jgi:CHASE3 domain sensor protein
MTKPAPPNQADAAGSDEPRFADGSTLPSLDNLESLIAQAHQRAHDLAQSDPAAASMWSLRANSLMAMRKRLRLLNARSGALLRRAAQEREAAHKRDRMIAIGRLVVVALLVITAFLMEYWG